MSTSISHLSELERRRYEDKINCIGVDLYLIKKTEWTNDFNNFPPITYPDIVNYLVFTPSPFSMEDLRAYKSLEAYNFFTSGWVRQPAVTLRNDLYVISARVRIFINLIR